MKVLAIDTATPAASVALVEDGRVLAEHLLYGGKNHSERLLEMIETLFKESSISGSALDLIAVSIGPGSFTGLRVGISTAQGLAFALEKPLAGVPTLDVLASQAVCGGMFVSPMIDARKQQIYGALYRLTGHGPELVRPPEVADPADWIQRLPGPAALIGSGAAVYRERIADLASARGCIIYPEHLGMPRASAAAMLAQSSFARGCCGAPELVRAMYVRPPDALIKEC